MFVDASAWTVISFGSPNVSNFTFACAKVHGVPLLYNGDDFALTDIEAA